MTTPEPRGLDAETAAVEGFIERVLHARRAVAAAQAAEAAALAEAHVFARRIADGMPGATSRAADMELRNLAAQVGAAARVPDRTVQSWMDGADVLLTRFPGTFTAWAEGRIDHGHVRVIIDAGVSIDDDEARAWFERHALERAETLTVGRLREVVKVLAEHAHPVPLTERHRHARAGRRVRVVDLDDGMARLIADMPAELAKGAHDRLTQMARQLRTALTTPLDENGDLPMDGEGGQRRGEGERDRDADADGGGDGLADPRTMDELRADIFADLLLTGVPAGHDDTAATPLGNTSGGLGAIAAHVQVTVPVLTALGRATEPATLAGHGPISLETALDLAGAATGWDRVLTHPVTGAVLDVDRYRPCESLRRHLRVRDEHCRHPGCRMPVWRCDLDHTIDHALGGHTCESNLATLCRRHHILKHHTAWTVRQLGGGILEWTSPTGRIYTDRPTPTVRFVPLDDPPPGPRRRTSRPSRSRSG